MMSLKVLVLFLFMMSMVSELMFPFKPRSPVPSLRRM
jgi:hypothetical protein